jgi:hypothetical protein
MLINMIYSRAECCQLFIQAVCVTTPHHAKGNWMREKKKARRALRSSMIDCPNYCGAMMD